MPDVTEHARALELAQRIADAADMVSAIDGASRRAAIKRLNGTTDNQYGVVQIARALLSTSSAVRGMREALELAEDVLSRSPFSTQMWPNGMHPNTGITLIRDALSLEGEDKQATRGDDAATAPTDRLQDKESSS